MDAMTVPAGARPSPKAELMRMIVGNWASQAIYTAAKLELADVLADGSLDLAAIADRVSARPGELRRLLRALESLGLFRDEGEDRFSATPLGAFLRKDRPDSLRPLSMFNGEELYDAWRELPYAVQTGEAAFERAHGSAIFDYLAEHGETGALFDSVMATVHGAEAPGVVASYDFSRFPTIVDVGGGKGSFVAEIVRRNEGVHGIVYDQPQVAARAEAYLAEHGLSDRCSVVLGSFFDFVPPEADAYLLRHVIHDWRDDEAGRILSNCRDAMKPTAKLFIVETIVPDGPAGPAAKLLDLNMLVICAGQERTRGEFERLLGRNGFHVEAIHATHSPRVALIECSVTS